MLSMRSFYLAALAILLGTCTLTAQDLNERLTVPVETTYEGSHTAFLLDGKDVVSGHFKPASALARNVVFVVDTASHQRSSAVRSQNYLAELARQVRGSSVSFTVIATDPQPNIAVRTSSLVGLQNAVLQPTIGVEGKGDEGRHFGQAIRLALDSLEEAEGDRTIIVLSDGDDDLSGSELKKLKTGFAQTHTRLFSILIANHDFFGTKAHSAWGVKLNALARFTGADQYETNWQHRASDPSVLMSVAARVSAGGQIRFSLPSQMAVRPGVHRLTVRVDETGASMKSGPFVVDSPAIDRR